MLSQVKESLTSAQAQELIDLAHQQHKVVSASQNRRWDGDIQTISRIVKQGYLGRLVEYESHFDRFRYYFYPERAWRETAGPGSGVLFDLGPHLIDQALVLSGLPQRVTADIRTQREAGKADDQFELIFHYDGLKVTLKAGLLARQPGPRFALHGTEGWFVKYGVDPQEEALKRGRSPQEPEWGMESEEGWGTLNLESSMSPLAASPDYADLSLAAALGHLDFRHDGRWRQSRPRIVAWVGQFAGPEPAYAATTRVA